MVKLCEQQLLVEGNLHGGQITERLELSGFLPSFEK